MTWFSRSYKRLLPLRSATPGGARDSEGLFFVDPPRNWELLYHRDTYYSAQLISILLVAFGLMATSAGDKEYLGTFFVAGFYSVLTLALAVTLLWWASKPPAQTEGRNTAVFHYSMSIIASITSFTAILFILLVPDVHSEPGDIKRLFIISIMLLWSVSTTATSVSAWITKSAAVRARGTGLVQVGPPRSAPAWTMASPLESESL